MSDQDLGKLFVDAHFDQRQREERGRNIRLFVTLAAILLLGAINYFSTQSAFSDEGFSFGGAKDYVAMVRITGEIKAGGATSALTVSTLLERAFKDDKAKGIVIVINSPGGSPVQSAIIRDEIMRLKKEKNKRVIVVGEELLTSGAYMIATAADEIVVHKSTMAGSVGVIMEQLNITDLAQKLGIEMLSFHAGEHKQRLSKFKKPTAEDVEKMNVLLGQIHQQFIAMVKESRGKKITLPDGEIFNGDYWSGEDAVKLGLADSIGDYHSAVAEFGVETFKDYSPRKSFLERLTGASVSAAAQFLLQYNDVSELQ